MDFWKWSPLIAIVGLGVVIMLDKSKISELEAKITSEETISSSLNSTVLRLESSQKELENEIAMLGANYEFVTKTLETFQRSSTKNQNTVREIRNERETLPNDDVGPSLRFSIGKLREWHETDYGPDNRR